MMQRAKSEYAIQTVTNALRVLEAFETDEQLGVTELSKRLDLHKNNVFRLLATLEEKQWVEQTDAELYRLGAKCQRLAHTYKRTRLLTRHARPALVALCRETGETAHLAVLGGFEVVHLDGEQSLGMVAGTLRVGDRLPSHCTALGKVLLACGARTTLEDYDREIISKHGVAARTEGTIVDRDKLIEHLRRVATQGFALDVEEYERGVSCAAVPVTDATGLLVGAFSVSGPSSRLDANALETRIVPLLLRAGATLSRALGASAASGARSEP
jgi:DNA-binding IclR family transcriptional regulator